MLIDKYTTKKKSKNDTEQSFCRCVVTVFQVIVFCHNVSNITAQDYMQSNVQAERIIQHPNLFAQHEMNTDVSSHQLDSSQVITTQADVVRFDPPYMDFDVQPLTSPVRRKVFLYNLSKTKSLKLNAISARTTHFHSSFFADKIIFPTGNSSFDVVYLAKEVGNVEDTLFINTALGTFTYQVFATGVPSPYQLRPFLGAKVPLNSTFSPLISMHNPTGSPLQVVEMYTSSGFLHLQLPTGLHEGSKSIWEIPPYETRPVMRASFLGQVADNHTAFIQIKTNHTDFAKYLILPVEVEVTTVPGIYSSLELLDFGTLRSKDKPKVLNLFLLNSGSKDVQITSINSSPSNPAIIIDFKPVKLKPAEAVFTRVANVSFDVKRAKVEEQWRGKIVVKTKEKSYTTLSIPYQANILDGNLGYEEGDNYFHIPAQEQAVKVSLTQNISLTNTFAFPIILHRLELPDSSKKFYKIVNFTSPCVIPTQDTNICFTIECIASAFRSIEGSRVSTPDPIHHVILHTNASTFSLPLHAFSGLLAFKIQNGNLADLDFGIMGTLDKRHLMLAVYNHNPLPVNVLDCNSTVQGVQINAVSLTNEGEDLGGLLRSQFRNFVLPPSSCLVLEVVMCAPKQETSFSGTLNIFTEFENLQIPLTARVAIGSLIVKPPMFKFRPSFPGMLVYQTISIASSFAQSTRIENISCLDKKFYYRKHKNIGVDLKPGKELKIGKVYFDARQDCKPDRCYVGLPPSTTVGHHWLMTLNLGKDAAEVDLKLYKTHRERWKEIQKQNATTINTTFHLSTSLVQSLEIATTAALYWPSLVAEPNYEFPLTLVGKKSTIQITLYNPADVPVIVQMLPLSTYPQPKLALDALETSELFEKNGFISNNTSVFNVSLTPNSSSQDTSSQMVWLEYTLNGKTNRSCRNMFLNPGEKQTMEVTFTPIYDIPVSTMILMRNNLTVLDAFLVKGRGVKETLKLGGKLSNSPREFLSFKLTESLLRDCYVEKAVERSAPSFTVRKTFTAMNVGLLPLTVHYMMIDNYPCEGYGFRILDCEPFTLQPKETREITIAFSPDFTTSLILHTLRLWTSQGNILTFNLNVTLPHHLLPLCQSAVPRPHWEENFFYVAAIVLVIGGVAVVLLAYLEAVSILDPFVKYYENRLPVIKPERNAQGFVKEKTFNLKEINADLCSNGVTDHRRRFRSCINRKHQGRSRKFLRSAQDFMNSIFSYISTRFWKKSRSKNQEQLTPTNVDEAEKVFEKPVPAVSKEFLRDTNVASLTPSITLSKQHRYKQSKKSKTNHNSWSTNANSSKGQENHNKPSTPETINSSWPNVQQPLMGKPNEGRKTPPDNTSGSSPESCRSRGSSTSSGLNESDKSKTDLTKLEGKRKRKNKSLRQAAFMHDHDDASSTTTDKSSEDYEEKLASITSSLKETNRKFANGTMKTRKHKSCSDSDSREPSISLPYRTANEQQHTLRRRLSRSYQAPVKQDQPSYRTRSITKLQSSAYYDTSSTDEPSWDMPKNRPVKQDVDDGMVAMSEQTRKIDTRLRMKTQRSKPILGNHSSSFSSVVSSSNEGLNRISSVPKPTTQKRQNLMKTQSMPDEITVPKQTGSFRFEPAQNRRNSNNEVNNQFSVFAGNGARNTRSNYKPLSLANDLPAWNNFGQNSFSITEGLVSYSPPIQSNPTLSSPQTSPIDWINYPSSIFTTPQTPPTSGWANSSNVLNLNIPPPPGTPTTPTLPPVTSESPAWGSSPSPTSRSTHAIWSVSNAVTMDEDRNTAENDPLGLKSIWNSGTCYNEDRKKFF